INIPYTLYSGFFVSYLLLSSKRINFFVQKNIYEMKKLLKLAVPAFAIMLGVASCDKVDTTPSTPSNNNPNPSTPAAPTPMTPSPTTDFWGIMVALKMEYSYNMSQLPMPVSLDYEMGVANFYSAAGSSSLVDAGSVSLNSND